MEIKFTDLIGVPIEFAPQPSFQVIPDWYKNTESYKDNEKMPDGKGSINATIKRCMPVFDAINSGYILKTYTDIWVKQIPIDPEFPEKTTPWIEWPSYEPIQFHPPEQATLHPKATGNPVPKWINPWGIKTPKGYSTLFVAPFHRKNELVALPGVVDTDEYDSPVNIVFTFANEKFEGLVPAGTPICQVIPFKRESWKMSIGSADDLKHSQETNIKLRTRFFDSYKNQFRQTKEYK